jgi:penicillin-binding protein-related factor A (putative recombinase)
MSYPKGISDILGVYEGRFLAIEVKRPGGRVSSEQRAFIERVNEEGGVGFVAYSVDDVVKRLELGVKLNPLFVGDPK